MEKMKLAHYYQGNQVAVGLVRDNRIYKIESVNSIDQILASGNIASINSSNSSPISVDQVRLAPPVLNPEKILCVAVNYKSHGTEQEMKPPDSPYFFTKFRNTLVGPEDPIILPKISKQVDWEVELAAVIGKKGKNIPKNQAENYIAGYTISNDVSYRDFQFPPGYPQKLNPFGMNWVKGKGLDHAFPLGPWLVTREEISDPYSLGISLKVNGRTRQDSSTEDLIFRLDALIEYVSGGMTLSPGDIISTGTPAGVAAFTDQAYLKNGDIVEASIEKIGTLRNPVKSE